MLNHSQGKSTFNSKKAGKKPRHFFSHVRFGKKTMMVPLFPVVMHITEISNFKGIEKDLIKCAYKYRKKDPKGRVISNRGGWQSSFLEKENSIIKSTLISVISSYFQSNKIYESNIKLGSLWVNINGKGNYNETHHHPTAHLSGVMWIKTPSDCGRIEFASPNDFVQGYELEISTKKHAEEYKAFPSYYFNPTAGAVIIFPSFLPHHVDPNNSHEDRISVSFNLLFNK